MSQSTCSCAQGLDRVLFQMSGTKLVLLGPPSGSEGRHRASVAAGCGLVCLSEAGLQRMLQTGRGLLRVAEKIACGLEVVTFENTSPHLSVM